MGPGSSGNESSAGAGGAPATLGVQALALSACSGAAGSLGEVTSVEVSVQPADGSRAFTSRGSVSGSSVGIGGVPEGLDQTVSLTAFKGDQPRYFGRQYGVLVEKGRDNPVDVALSAYGGYSCPQAEATFTQRAFSTATPLGGRYFLLAGGFTESKVAGTVTTFEAGDASRDAFIYDSARGTLTKLAKLAENARGAHAAVFVAGSEKSQVVLVGGAKRLRFDSAATNGFGWGFDPADASKVVEVFEFTTGTNPALTGTFISPPDGLGLRAGRVLPTAISISGDGLVMVCGGGPWGGDEPSEYDECDVVDAPKATLLAASKNFPLRYRAGGAVAPYGDGEVTKLIYVGGSRNLGEGQVELYHASSSQRGGSGGSFNFPDNGFDSTEFVTFPTLTALGNGRFAMVGGLRRIDTGFEPPSAANAVLLTVTEDGPRTYVEDTPLPGLDVGRYFHTAAAPAGDRLVIAGGFSNGSALEPTASVRLIEIVKARSKDDPTVKTSYTGLVGPVSEADFVARGGVGAVLLDNDTLLLAGGISAAADLDGGAGTLEVYTPSNLLPVVLPVVTE